MGITNKKHSLILVAALSAAGVVCAESETAWSPDASIQMDVLDAMRGGMLTEHGLAVNLGIQRDVYVNGELVTTTTLTLSDLSRLLGGAAPQAAIAGDAGTLVQTGLGNTHVTPLDSSSLATVIQNTLDNQVIRTVTQINANVSNVELLRGMSVTANAADMIGRSR